MRIELRLEKGSCTHSWLLDLCVWKIHGGLFKGEVRGCLRGRGKKTRKEGHWVYVVGHQYSENHNVSKAKQFLYYCFIVQLCNKTTQGTGLTL